ncbi:MAG TPA: ABC transporter permease [Gemmataceae bacterium]|jgi:ABC transporter DrrB family efflux protein
MKSWYPFTQLFLTRLREFYREPQVLFWVYGFPLILALGLAIAFWNRKPEQTLVDVQEGPGAQQLADRLRTAHLAVEVLDAQQCYRRRLTGRTMLYVVPLEDGRVRYVYDETQPESRAAYFQVDAALLRHRDPNWIPDENREPEPGNRYIDFLLPGLLGMNLMGGGLWGVGFVIVDMRVRKLLKRLLATPMRRDQFLLAILTARMVILLPEMVLLLLVGHYLGVPIRGSLWTLGLAIFVGASAFSGIGLVLASRTDKTETISGLMNLVMLPMWLLSGTFFSAKRFPDAVQPIIQALPLTQLNNALREVMLEGASFAEVAWRMAILAALALGCFLLALRWFRWQ